MLRRMSWSGHHFTFRIARHWDAFFGLAALYEIRNVSGSKRLPPGAGEHLLGIYDLVERSRDVFSSGSEWYSWSQSVCDQYGDAYVLRRPRPDNLFWFGLGRSDDERVKVNASEHRSFIGPKDWWLK